jgi:hypothetical protein
MNIDLPRRRSFTLTKETERQLHEICKAYGENGNQVFVRAISYLYNYVFKTQSEDS